MNCEYEDLIPFNVSIWFTSITVLVAECVYVAIYLKFRQTASLMIKTMIGFMMLADACFAMWVIFMKEYYTCFCARQFERASTFAFFIAAC